MIQPIFRRYLRHGFYVEIYSEADMKILEALAAAEDQATSETAQKPQIPEAESASGT
jgi:hypothetical protein